MELQQRNKTLQESARVAVSKEVEGKKKAESELRIRYFNPGCEYSFGVAAKRLDGSWSRHCYITERLQDAPPKQSPPEAVLPVDQADSCAAATTDFCDEAAPNGESASLPPTDLCDVIGFSSEEGTTKGTPRVRPQPTSNGWIEDSPDQSSTDGGRVTQTRRVSAPRKCTVQ